MKRSPKADQQAEAGEPLALADLFLETYPMLVAMARRRKPEAPHALVHQRYLTMVKGLAKGKYRFCHVGAFVNHMKHALRGLRDKDRPKEKQAEGENAGPATDRLPSLVAILDDLRDYAGPSPCQVRSQVPVWSEPNLDEARERTIAALMLDFAAGRRKKAEGLIPLLRITIDPIWDRHFEHVYPAYHPVSVHFDAGLNAAMGQCLLRLPTNSDRWALQEALELVGLDQIPKLARDIQLGPADLKEELLAYYLLACDYFSGLKGEDRAIGAAVVLHHIDGLTHKEVAARLKVTIKIARTLTAQGMSDLRRLILHQGHGRQGRRS